MDIVQVIAQFFYRIRYWLLLGGFIVTVLVAYFTQFLPFSYTVNKRTVNAMLSISRGPRATSISRTKTAFAALRSRTSIPSGA